MDFTPRMKASAEVARRAAAESMVLLKNEQLLPFAAGTKLAVFGVGQVHTIKGGTGSGEVNNLKSINILDGLTACDDLVIDEVAARAYRAWALEHPMVRQGLFGSSQNYNDEMPIVRLDLEALAAANDAAVIVISRVMGEGADMEAAKGTIFLTDEEDTMVRAVCKAFSKTVLLLNVAGYMEIAGYLPELTAAMFIGLPGQEGGYAVADVLTGAVPVGGRLTDTWPLSYSDYPNADYYSRLIPNGNQSPNQFTRQLEDQSDVPYYDDIYVGYRYFDTFGKEVLFPFGYGLSYGEPEMSTCSVALEQDKVTVTATIVNKSETRATRDVVQVYVSKPDGKLEKPYQELIGYAKTGLLAPGASETVTVTFPASAMASYDMASASYILEPGMYYIRVGSHSRHTLVAGAVEIPSEIRVQQLANLLGEVPADFKTMSKAGVKPITYANESKEKNTAASHALRLPEREMHCVNASYSSDYVSAQPKPGLTLVDVAEGRGTCEELAATMEFEDLCRLVCGQGMDMSGFDLSAMQPPEGMEAPPAPPAPAADGEEGGDDVFAALASMMGGPKVKFEVPGEAGQSPDLWEKYRIPPIVLCDGPAGVRITRDIKEDGEIVGHQYCTAFPTGSLLACSFDNALLEEMGKAVGVEMAEYRVDLWLAPGLNIHRSPLCGRNFEYFSEDPEVAGLCTAAITRGVQGQGGGVTIKHFAGNNQEFMRGNSSDTVTERAMREIYLRGFEIAVRTADPKAVMTSYNDINGVPNADNYDLCTAILRDEWGFNGLVMTDWGGGISTPAISMWAGNDMIQPGGPLVVDSIRKAVEKGEPVVSKGMAHATIIPTRAMVEKSAVNILKVVLRTLAFDRKK